MLVSMHPQLLHFLIHFLQSCYCILLTNVSNDACSSLCLQVDMLCTMQPYFRKPGHPGSCGGQQPRQQLPSKRKSSQGSSLGIWSSTKQGLQHRSKGWANSATILVEKSSWHIYSPPIYGFGTNQRTWQAIVVEFWHFPLENLVGILSLRLSVLAILCVKASKVKLPSV